MKKITIKKIVPVFEDERGAIYDIIEEKVGHSGLITFTKGAKRGDHYHKKSVQYTYVIDGILEFSVKDAEDKNAGAETYILKRGDLAIIPPLMAHRYTAVEAATILDFTTLSRSDSGYEEDTVRISWI